MPVNQTKAYELNVRTKIQIEQLATHTLPHWNAYKEKTFVSSWLTVQLQQYSVRTFLSIRTVMTLCAQHGLIISSGTGRTTIWRSVDENIEAPFFGNEFSLKCSALNWPSYGNGWISFSNASNFSLIFRRAVRCTKVLLPLCGAIDFAER